MTEIRRLGAGDEAEAIEAIHVLKPAAERAGHDASPGHMRALLAREENYLYVASVDAAPVGFLLAYRVPRVDRDQDMVYLYEIDVVAEHRRRGVGSLLVRALKEECRGRNVMKMWVGTETGNVAARALYESTGATCEGEAYAEYTFNEF
jgi:ribosomal protein S18 acetylase RimI-like enzyme